MIVPPAQRLPLRIKIGFAFGSIAYGVKENGFSVLLMLFYNQVLGLDAGIVGLILLGALLLDAIIDPLVGYWSDHTHSRWGQRHPWQYASIIPMALAWTMLWYPPETKGPLLYAHLMLFAFLMRAAVSAFEVPGLSIVPALTSDYDERTSITRWRFLFGWVGGLITLAAAFTVFLVPEPGYPIGQFNLNGYKYYGQFGAVLILVTTLVSALTTHRRIASLPFTPPTHHGFAASIVEIRETLANRAYLTLLGSTLFAFINLGVIFSITSYLLTFVWRVPQSGFLVYAVSLFVGVVGAFLLVGAVQEKVEKRQAAFVFGLLGLAFGVAPYVLRYLGFFPENDSAYLIPLLFTLIAIGNGFGAGASIVMQSMLSDVVEAAQVTTGRRSEGMFSAGYFFVQKCTTGLGLVITGLIISLSGLPEKAIPGRVSDSVLDHLIVSFIISLMVLTTISVSIIRKFPITRAEHQARVRALAKT